MDVETVQLSMDHAADLADPPQTRSSGLHVSELVNASAKLTGNRWYGNDEPSDQQVNIMALGRLVEWMVRPAIHELAQEKGLVFQPQQVLTVDDVTGSLDGILVSSEGGGVKAVVECKSRHASPEDPSSNWRYMAQGMAYCFMAVCTTLWMPIVYLPRRGPPNAEFMLHVIEFEPHELLENWTMLTNVKDYVGGKE